MAPQSKGRNRLPWYGPLVLGAVSILGGLVLLLVLASLPKPAVRALLAPSSPPLAHGAELESTAHPGCRYTLWRQPGNPSLALRASKHNAPACPTAE